MSSPSPSSRILALAAGFCVIIPAFGWFLAQPTTRQAIRALLDRLPGD
jgi:hypothetical protein